MTGFWGEHELSFSLSIRVNNVPRSLGPKGLSNDALYPQNPSVIPTVTDNLFAQGAIEQNLVAVSFEPNSMSTSIINGELTFGATDPTKYTGNISYL
jgi:cathepsin E